MQYSANEYIAFYQMQPHPEGGYYKELYRSAETIPRNGLPARFLGDRNFSTSIYYLLCSGQSSTFHRIQSDECWHFYAGGRLVIYIIDNTGEMQIIFLGDNLAKKEIFQFVVPAGCWFASEPAKGTSFSLVGCTVAPGFEFTDFEIANRQELIEAYPQHQSIIQRLTLQPKPYQ